MAAAKALHVGVIHGGKFIDDRWFAAGSGDITVGEGEKNSFAVPFSALPRSHALFHRRSGACSLSFTADMQVKVEADGKELDLKKSARRAGALFELPLTDDSRGRVSMGEVTFVFNFAAPPKVPPRPVLPKEARGTLWNVTDHTFATVLLISLLLHGAAVGAISRRDLPPEEAAMEEIPDRFARLLIPDKPPEVEQPPEEQKAVEEKPAEEEKPAAKEEKAKAKDSAEHKAAVQKAVAQKGLVKILGSVGAGGSGGALANVLAAGGGFSDDIGAALAGAGGVALATEGSGGPVRKGEGAAQASGIGGIATSGGGGVKMREKADVAVRGSVSQEGDAEVDSPSVDKAALSRFINLRKGSIQGCYEAQLKRSPSLHGKLVLRFTIGTRGQIVEVSIDSDTLGSDELASCITRLVKAWRMPFSPDADTTVTFPFLFHPG
jgi:outer membrane biosynthesis protein TonB